MLEPGVGNTTLEIAVSDPTFTGQFRVSENFTGLPVPSNAGVQELGNVTATATPVALSPHSEFGVAVSTPVSAAVLLFPLAFLWAESNQSSCSQDLMATANTASVCRVLQLVRGSALRVDIPAGAAALTVRTPPLEVGTAAWVLVVVAPEGCRVPARALSQN